jgi:hypothetical protein
LKTKNFKTAEKYLNRLQKQYPRNALYFIDLGILYQNMTGEAEATKVFEEVIRRLRNRQYNTSTTAQYFLNKNLPEYALESYLVSRELTKQQSIYTLEIANIYRLLDNREGMVSEYLNYIDSNPRNINYVKNILQSLLTGDEDLQSFELALYDRIQADPDNTLNNQLLIWVKLQMNDFPGALIQAKALDRKQLSAGQETIQIGDIALRNKDYETAIKAYQHVNKYYENGPQYIRSRQQIIRARELQLTSSYPVDTAGITKLISDYKILIRELGVNRSTLEASRNMALLYANYLNRYEVAVGILEEVIANPRSGQLLKAKAKLNLGDIYIYMEQPWESTLLYSQVEKENKETPIGYEAKLRNAKLNYYTGNFTLAEGHLSILKDATTREIANDALDLSLLIKNNSIGDTSNAPLADFDHVDLMIFKKK